MSTPARHRGIIVGVDGSPPSKVAIDWAARDAVMRKIPLTVVNVLYSPMVSYPPTAVTFPETRMPMPMPPEYMQWQEDEGRKILNDALKTVEESTKQGAFLVGRAERLCR